VAAVLLALGSSLSFGIADFFGGVVTRRHAVVVVLLVSQTVGLAGIALVVLARGDGPPDAGFVPLALAASVLGVVGLAALYRGLATGMMSVVAPIAATASCVAVIAGIATGETPTGLQNAGIALALGGVILVSLARSEGEVRMRLTAGAGLGLVAAACFGAFLIAFDRAATDDPYWATLVLRLGSVALLAGVALAVGPRPSRALGAATFLLLGSIGLLDAAGNALFAVASTKGVVGVVAVLSSLYPVVTVALARFVLKERLQPRQAVGVVCALAGVALIAAG
jgi:drug/metabolite transporter (DMT)-like permease